MFNGAGRDRNRRGIRREIDDDVRMRFDTERRHIVVDPPQITIERDERTQILAGMPAREASDEREVRCRSDRRARCATHAAQRSGHCNLHHLAVAQRCRLAG
jgi:hypothetical protein